MDKFFTGIFTLDTHMYSKIQWKFGFHIQFLISNKNFNFCAYRIVPNMKLTIEHKFMFVCIGYCVVRTFHHFVFRSCSDLYEFTGGRDQQNHNAFFKPIVFYETWFTIESKPWDWVTESLFSSCQILQSLKWLNHL